MFVMCLMFSLSGKFYLGDLVGSVSCFPVVFCVLDIFFLCVLYQMNSYQILPIISLAALVFSLLSFSHH